MNKLLKQVAAGAMISAFAVSANAGGLPFTVDTTTDTSPGVSGALSTFIADEINGTYVEGINVKSATEFSASIVLDFTGFSGIPDFISGLNIDYDMYAVIDVVGSITPAGGLFELADFTGDISVYADWDNDSNLDAVGPFNPAGVTFGFDVAGNVESIIDQGTADVLLATTTDLAGGTNVGVSSSFALFSDTLALTPAGEDVFVAPRPFYNMLFSDGNISDLFTEVDFGMVTTSIQEFTAQADIIFVPEPSAAALLGLGLFSLGFSRRLKK
ncbi:flocculation-associated PEP-CTERM protein PepA [Agaribacter marinus]|uniref:Ice-binding protein C-terminal domain-containing protein n=1 Tax=Agaribacter marinus TaxID=1431249 RepID=A0AA37T181_9ALTE|nr:flocculation-associated PEP-CTERM protein PepA [Agaribacter marinus]GLR71880.1 hypothetical protein GCM10007852_27880 [Agaribacter marinus]